MGRDKPLTKDQLVLAFRRDQLLNAAHMIFATKGFAAATVDEIAATAGVAKGTVYLYFASKEEVYWAALNRGLDELHERTRRAIEAADTVLSKLRAFMATRIEFFETHADFFRVYVGEVSNIAAPPARARKEFRRRRTEQIAMLEEVLQHAAANRSIRAPLIPGVGDYIVAVTHSLALRRVQGDSRNTVDDDLSSAIDLLWRGLAPTTHD